MITAFQDQLARAESLLDEAARCLVTEIPAGLSRVVALLEAARSSLQDLPIPDRASALAQLKTFHKKLSLFSSAMKRSEAIFQGYSRNAGISLHQYGPAGGFAGARDPAFFNLTI